MKSSLCSPGKQRGPRDVKRGGGESAHLEMGCANPECFVDQGLGEWGRDRGRCEGNLAPTGPSHQLTGEVQKLVSFFHEPRPHFLCWLFELSLCIAIVLLATSGCGQNPKINLFWWKRVDLNLCL